ncbi:MAG: hypothetical protein ACP5T4_03780 [Candidatus Micrarchaeia archaeon]
MNGEQVFDLSTAVKEIQKARRGLKVSVLTPINSVPLGFIKEVRRVITQSPEQIEEICIGTRDSSFCFAYINRKGKETLYIQK